MGRPKKNNLMDTVKDIVSSKKTTEKKKEETKKVVEETTETLKEVEEPIVDTEPEQEVTTTEETESVIETNEVSEESPKQFIDEVVYTNDNQPKDTSNFKPVQVMKDSELDYFKKRSEIIARLKQDPKYKFLSMISLIKIADIYMKKNY